MDKPIPAPDVIVRLHLVRTEDGGRRQTIRSYESHGYGCLLSIDAEYFDCRWLLAEDEILAPGTQHRVAIKFLDRSLVKPRLVVGKNIKMWEGKVIADGHIEEIFC